MNTENLGAYIKGVNLGGFLSQQEANPQKKDFVTEKDIIYLKKLGFTTIRLPVDYFFFEVKPFVYDLSKVAEIDNTIELCRKHKLKVILDLHKAPGHTFESKGLATNDIWIKNSESRQRFLAIWDFLSIRYKGKVFFEVMNEAVAPDNKQWLSLLSDAIKTIRKNDKTSWIVVGSNLWNAAKQYKRMKKFNDSRILYTFHFYEPHVITHQKASWMPGFELITASYPGKPDGLSAYVKQSSDARQNEWIMEQDKQWDIIALEHAMKPALDFKKKHKVPMFCGEFGVIASADPLTRQNWTRDVLKLFKKHKIGFSYWSYKNMNFGLFDYTKDYASNKNYKKNKDEAMIKLLTE